MAESRTSFALDAPPTTATGLVPFLELEVGRVDDPATAVDGLDSQRNVQRISTTARADELLPDVSFFGCVVDPMQVRLERVSVYDTSPSGTQIPRIRQANALGRGAHGGS